MLIRRSVIFSTCSAKSRARNIPSSPFLVTDQVFEREGASRLGRSGLKRRSRVTDTSPTFYFDFGYISWRGARRAGKRSCPSIKNFELKFHTNLTLSLPGLTYCCLNTIHYPNRGLIHLHRGFRRSPILPSLYYTLTVDALHGHPCRSTEHAPRKASSAWIP